MQNPPHVLNIVSGTLLSTLVLLYSPGALASPVGSKTACETSTASLPEVTALEIPVSECTPIDQEILFRFQDAGLKDITPRPLTADTLLMKVSQKKEWIDDAKKGPFTRLNVGTVPQTEREKKREDLTSGLVEILNTSSIKNSGHPLSLVTKQNNGIGSGEGRLSLNLQEQEGIKTANTGLENPCVSALSFVGKIREKDGKQNFTGVFYLELNSGAGRHKIEISSEI